MKKIITLNFLPFSTDLGLLVLRAWLGTTMVVAHGKDKLMNPSGPLAFFQSLGFPPAIGWGAIIAESLFAVLLVLGLATRWAAAFLTVTMAVAFFVAHKGLIDPKLPKESGELAFIYLAGFLAIFLAGPGRFSVDAKLK